MLAVVMAASLANAPFIRFNLDVREFGIHGTGTIVVDRLRGRFVRRFDTGPAGDSEGYDGTIVWTADAAGSSYVQGNADTRARGLRWARIYRTLGASQLPSQIRIRVGADTERTTFADVRCIEQNFCAPFSIAITNQQGTRTIRVRTIEPLQHVDASAFEPPPAPTTRVSTRRPASRAFRFPRTAWRASQTHLAVRRRRCVGERQRTLALPARHGRTKHSHAPRRQTPRHRPGGNRVRRRRRFGNGALRLRVGKERPHRRRGYAASALHDSFTRRPPTRHRRNRRRRTALTFHRPLRFQGRHPKPRTNRTTIVARRNDVADRVHSQRPRHSRFGRRIPRPIHPRHRRRRRPRHQCPVRRKERLYTRYHAKPNAEIAGVGGGVRVANITVQKLSLGNSTVANVKSSLAYPAPNSVSDDPTVAGNIGELVLRRWSTMVLNYRALTITLSH